MPIASQETRNSAAPPTFTRTAIGTEQLQSAVESAKETTRQVHNLYQDFGKDIGLRPEIAALTNVDCFLQFRTPNVVMDMSASRD